VGALTERSRVEWWLGDAADQPLSGDPLQLLEDFLAAHGLPVRNLSAAPLASSKGPVYGAAIFVSSAASAYALGAPVGPATPSLSVPDVVAVIYAEDPVRRSVERAADPGGWRVGAWRGSWTAQRHAEAVGAVRAAIGRGDVYQVNVVGHARAAYRGDPLPALGRVAALPGARYGGVLAGADWALASASPETLVDVRAGRAVTRPIKGTRPADEAGRRALLASAKERAEHVMIVDLERNDLARVARTGTVRVDELYAVRRWCDLWQAESTVSAELAPGVGLAALLRAVGPGGSVTGAPKRAALAEIARLEPVGRGPSMGALGWVGHDGIRLGLSIRTVAAESPTASRPATDVPPPGAPTARAVDPEGHLHVWAGGGITWGSDPAAEVAEAAAKAAPLRAALEGR
jgi:para-aminobenzoate synthetase component 1